MSRARCTGAGDLGRAGPCRRGSLYRHGNPFTLLRPIAATVGDAACSARPPRPVMRPHAATLLCEIARASGPVATRLRDVVSVGREEGRGRLSRRQEARPLDGVDAREPRRARASIATGASTAAGACDVGAAERRPVRRRREQGVWTPGPTNGAKSPRPYPRRQEDRRSDAVESQRAPKLTETTFNVRRKMKKTAGCGKFKAGRPGSGGDVSKRGSPERRLAYWHPGWPQGRRGRVPGRPAGGRPSRTWHANAEERRGPVQKNGRPERDLTFWTSAAAGGSSYRFADGQRPRRPRGTSRNVRSRIRRRCAIKQPRRLRRRAEQSPEAADADGRRDTLKFRCERPAAGDSMHTREVALMATTRRQDCLSTHTRARPGSRPVWPITRGGRRALTALLRAPLAIRTWARWPSWRCGRRRTWVYQVVRKPTERSFPVQALLARAPPETWRRYGALFHRHATVIITPELLAALAQVRRRRQSRGTNVLAVASDVESLRAVPARLERGRDVPDHRCDVQGGEALPASTTTWWSRRRLGTTCARAGFTASTRGSCPVTPSS